MAKNEVIWVTGAKGFLGSEIAKRLEKHGYTVVGTDSELSVCEPERLESFANEVRPYAIVNCAGIPRAATGLSNRIRAYEVNALGARNVAVVANEFGSLMVQVSTDDVFPSRMSEPANEFDVPHPETPYGKSKRAGEAMVRDSGADCLVLRSSWIYSENGGMLKDALVAARTGGTTYARTDQYASPTSISMYVDYMVKAIEKRITGVLHISGKGVASRYQFLSTALKMCGYDPSSVLVPEQDLVTAEQILLESMVLEMVGSELPTWEDDLRNYLKEIGAAK